MQALKQTPFKKYLSILLLCYICLIILNIWTDPQRQLPFTLSDNPKYFAEGGRVEKSVKLQSEQFDTLILGSSRLLLGINPDNRNFNSHSIYNLGFTGIRLAEYERVLRYIEETQDIKTLYFGLDFLSFNKDRKYFGDYKKSLFMDNKSYVFGLLDYLLSIKTGAQSIANSVLSLKSEEEIRHTNDKGFIVGMNSRINYGKVFEREIIRNLATAEHEYVYDYEGEKSLKKHLEKLAQKSVNVVLFIPPVHAMKLEVIHQNDQFEHFEQWKRNLVSLSEQVSREQNSNIILWDFTGYNKFSTERIPHKDESDKQMKFFWEASHFKEVIGDLIIDSIINGTDNDIGAILNSENISGHLLKIRQGRAQYLNGNPDVVQILDSIVASQHPH